jgi:di/tricarboxylate transporter
MSWQLLFTLFVTLAAVALFVTEKLRIDLVALLVMASLLASGVVTPQEGIQGFSNPATVTIGAMFVLAEGLRRTGLAEQLGDTLGRLFAKNYTAAMAAMMFGIGLISIAISNTAVVAIFMPVLISASRDANISSTRVLMPLSFAAMFGGVCTLIGTSTNILISSVMEQHQMAPIGMFEMAPIGALFLVTGVLYMLTVGEWLMPDHADTGDLTESYEIHEYLTEVQILEGADSEGKPLKDAPLTKTEGVDILEIVREGETVGKPDGTFVLRHRDIVKLRAPAEVIPQLDLWEGLQLRPQAEVTEEELGIERNELLEAVIAPDSQLVGRSLHDLALDEQFDLHVLAVRRERELLHGNLMEQPLQGGDVLLLQTTRDRIPQIQRHRAFVVVSEVSLPDVREHLTLPALLILAGVIATVALNFFSIVTASILGCLALILLGVVTVEEAYESINWQVIFLLAGILTLGVALENTGGVDLITDLLVNSVGDYGGRALLAGFYGTTAILTCLMSNQATAVLLTPVAIDAAHTMGLDPRPFVLAIAFASSASFMTPIGYQTNTMIYGAGQYKFRDFVVIGTPLTLLFAILAVFILPLLWPM